MAIHDCLGGGPGLTACHVVWCRFTQTGHKSFTHFRLTCCDAFPYSHEGVIALDELGLDYANRSGDDGEPDQVKLKKLQQTVIRRQLAVATRRRLLLVIHSRDATFSRWLRLTAPPLELEVLAGYFLAALPVHHAVSGFLGSRTTGPGRANNSAGSTVIRGGRSVLPAREGIREAHLLAPGNGYSGRNSPDDVITAVQENARRMYTPYDVA
ncbi:hypothetical protein HPB49_008620 [Dermacentor silvarum]|uniref:Uncharacterized protein n=1 Tax=Dermacentor silvarum TaxID=543639 RepID=A0ACB8DY36_DERSI|nr:hypothetical protein HPB49_008620 [Dermacentor silvarum]